MTGYISFQLVNEMTNEQYHISRYYILFRVCISCSLILSALNITVLDSPIQDGEKVVSDLAEGGNDTGQERKEKSY